MAELVAAAVYFLTWDSASFLKRKSSVLLHAVVFLFASINKLAAAKSHIFTYKSAESLEGESAGFYKRSRETLDSACTPVLKRAQNTATKARDDEDLLALTQTWAQTSNGAFKAPDDLRCEKFAETLEPPSRFSQPPHSEKGVCGMEKHLSRIHSGDLHKARSEDGRTEYYAAFFWRVENTSCYVSPK